ncbi:MAG: AAA family ATPase [Pyrinomonadaceae bacterium]|nr:AAA family ATPase [Pyrinomonadaceae bacterium]
MNVTIPVLVTEEKQEKSSVTVQTVRPLFALNFEESAESLQRALNKLANTMRQQIEEFGKLARHDDVANLTFSPSLQSSIVKFRLNFGAKNFDCRYFFVTLNAFDKRIAFTPNIAGIWFDLERGESLQTRAETVLDAHFRLLEKRDGKNSQDPEYFNFVGKTWLTTVDFDVALQQKFERKEENFLAFLGGANVESGAEELRKTGSCLDWLYPQDLERATRRETELSKLIELAANKDNRPILIVGKPQTGKTALVNEFVFRLVGTRKFTRQPEENVWQLSPQRLISGMMYVGQWEERLLAIVKEAKEKQHLLYFDDLLGLFFAGQSRDSDLSMAQVLKPYIERRDIRILAEITLTGFRVLQERDRAFADLFQILRLEETDDDETLKIALGVRRELEHKYNCQFELETLPTVLDLTRRYVRESAFPGKAANFLKQLSSKFRDKKISRTDVLREFELKSGLSVAFLDDNAKLERAEIVKKISQGVIGQGLAVEAAADVISIAKSRLNDDSRPLASLLFLGATGVGKTEAAKQIAKYLYGDEDKLLRFDMNEFVSAYDVSRLVGTFDQPEGLLTSAIRRSPFAVILLDEIEKAHPDVFNLLLQVMGDGRLTDALGRTADFTNSIVILTSNLGAREANQKLGFRQTNETEAHVYRNVAEKFFKPEFFNRLDRVIPFERLRRQDVETIAANLLQKLFRRDGLARRNCKISVAPEALQIIVNEGYHPLLGARALKRAIEKNLAQPVAAKLAALLPNAPILIQISADKSDKITVSVEEIIAAETQKSVWMTRDFSDVNINLDSIEDALDRIEAEIEHLKPRGEINPQDKNQARYFLVKEHVDRIERMIERAEKWHERDESFKFQVSGFKSEANNPKLKTALQSKKSQRHLVTLRDSAIEFESLLREPNLATRLKNLVAENRAFGEQITDYLQDIWREVSLLQTLADNLDKQQDSRCLISIHSNESQNIDSAKHLLQLYKEFFGKEIGVKIIEEPASEVDNHTFRLILQGAHAFDFVSAERGTHLIVSPHAGFAPLEVAVFEMNSNGDLINENPSQTKNSVVRIYEKRIDSSFCHSLDLRSGLQASDVLTVRELRAFVLSGLKANLLLML